MALTLAELLEPRSAATWQQLLLGYCQGIGGIQQEGIGSGSLAVTGAPFAPLEVRLLVTVEGDLGTAAFSYEIEDQLGNVSRSSSDVVIPNSGVYFLSNAGVTLTFTDGGESPSFFVGDTFEFGLFVPTMPVTSWQPGSTAPTIIDALSRALEDSDITVDTIASGGLTKFVGSIGLSADAWADILADNFYNLPRRAAVSTQGTVTLTDSGAGPFTIASGDVYVSTAGGLRFFNVTGGTLPLNGTLDLTFQSEAPGSVYNVGNGTIVVLVTSLAGVTVANPDPGSGTWVTQNGTDAETTTTLMLRCQQRWPGLGGGATAAVYQFWALTASDQVTRASVITDNVIAGHVDIYLAGSAGGVSSPVVTAVQDYIDARLPLCVTAVVASATNHPITVTATVYVKTASLATAQAAASANLTAYFADLPIGGDFVPGLPGGITGIVSREEIIAAIGKVAGVVDLSMSAPAADTNLAVSEVATLTENLTWITV